MIFREISCLGNPKIEHPNDSFFLEVFHLSHRLNHNQIVLPPEPSQQLLSIGQYPFPFSLEFPFEGHQNQEFENINIENSIIFPHHILEHSGKVSYSEIRNIFLIFESIYTKNHLDNINYKMPVNFINFKNLILNYLKENNYD